MVVHVFLKIQASRMILTKKMPASFKKKKTTGFIPSDCIEKLERHKPDGPKHANKNEAKYSKH